MNSPFLSLGLVSAFDIFAIDMDDRVLQGLAIFSDDLAGNRGRLRERSARENDQARQGLKGSGKIHLHLHTFPP